MLKSNLSEIQQDYDAFLVDLWGVIHDGENIYPGAREALEKLKSQGKQVVFLSNAPRRKTLAAEGLLNVRVSSDLYYDVITSGEVTFEYVTSLNFSFGNKYYLINEQQVDLLDNSGKTRVKNPNDADFVVAIGFENHTSTLEEKAPELEACKAKNLPMICANPDMVVVNIIGESWLCAGVLAEAYIKMGGDVQYFGKPYPEIYTKAIDLLKKTPKSRIAAIGDNLNTDILGANNFGIDSYFIAGGIHAKELGIKHGTLPDLIKAEELSKKYNSKPTGILPGFIY